MAKFGWDERRLFNVSEAALENLSVTPSDADAGQSLVFIKSDHLHIKNDSDAEVLIPEDGSSIGGGIEVFKQKNASAQLEFRTLQSSDGTINFTQNADDIDITVDLSDINDELDHGQLLGLADDDHAQYLLLAGRSGGQIANGGTAAGEDLELRSTANATKGSVQIIDGSEFRHSDVRYNQYTLQTTDNTVQTIATIPLDDNKVYSFEVNFLSRRSDGGGEARSMFMQRACAYRAGAGALLQGSVQQTFKSASSGVDTNIAVSGNNVIVTVKGLTGEDHEWKAYVKVIDLSVA